MNWKKAVALGIVAVGAVSLFTGCGNSTNNSNSSSKPNKIVAG